jgi:hypothetical protein
LIKGPGKELPDSYPVSSVVLFFGCEKKEKTEDLPDEKQKEQSTFAL